MQLPITKGHVTVGVVAYDQIDDLDFFGAWSVLAKAAQASACDSSAAFRVHIVGAHNAFLTSSGLSVSVPAEVPPDRLDAVLVPGGTGAIAAAQRSDLRDLLVRYQRDGSRCYTICSGALLLAAAGLLTDRSVSIHAAKREALRLAGAGTVTRGLRRDGWLTSIGGSMAPGVKGVDIGFIVVGDLRPDLLDSLRSRMEIGES
ncbi:DJ-1/PfpI family protein [Sphingomonas sanguinis]|uniref:DJ-1/PfpI family protein n=1 Tax=Sphingomonas sanguinis TaxID=33051 RepID=UPI000736AFC4|nr:DJ-1/PfpI family protein [Sphingomonas sanguinis]